MYEKELSVALRAAVEAGSIQMKEAGEHGLVQKKDDNSPVTEVDKECEKKIKEILLNEFCNDGFLGEESEELHGNNNRRWIVDPLDGTRPFIRGIPTHSVLIALEAMAEPVIGIIYLPALNCLCYGISGKGAFINNKPVKVSSTDSLDKAMGSTLGWAEYAGRPEGDSLLELMKKWDYTYGFMDAYSYVCVASGKIDACVNLLDKAWDCAAAACIVKEAGGFYSDIEGQHTIHNGSIVLTNGTLHSQVLSFFTETKPGEQFR